MFSITIRSIKIFYLLGFMLSIWYLTIIMINNAVMLVVYDASPCKKGGLIKFKKLPKTDYFKKSLNNDVNVALISFKIAPINLRW